jgi:hypothetical protein
MSSGKKDNTECKMSITQQKFLCDFRQTQLNACASHLLHTIRMIVLGVESGTSKVVDAEHWTIAQIQDRLALIRSPGRSAIALDMFCRAAIQSEESKNLPQLLKDLCESYITFLQLTIVLSPNLMERLWNFLLRACFERPVLLCGTKDDFKGTVLDMFLLKLSTFCAACLSP